MTGNGTAGTETAGTGTAGTRTAGTGDKTVSGIGLGLLALALEKVPGRSSGDRLDLAVGLLALGSSRARQAAARVVDPSVRLTGWCAARVNELPGANLVREPLSRGQQRLEGAMSGVRRQGAATVAISRERAVRLIRSNLDGVIGWVQTDIAPKMIDGLVPYLKRDVVPPLIAGSLPQIRADVVPTIIGDLTVDPRVRNLIVDQSRGVLAGATQEVRTTTANADDRIESAVRRIFGRRSAIESG